jgi:hypothetical protein
MQKRISAYFDAYREIYVTMKGGNTRPGDVDRAVRLEERIVAVPATSPRGIATPLLAWRRPHPIHAPDMIRSSETLY